MVRTKLSREHALRDSLEQLMRTVCVAVLFSRISLASSERAVCVVRSRAVCPQPHKLIFT